MIHQTGLGCTLGLDLVSLIGLGPYASVHPNAQLAPLLIPQPVAPSCGVRSPNLLDCLRCVGGRQLHKIVVSGWVELQLRLQYTGPTVGARKLLPN